MKKRKRKLKLKVKLILFLFSFILCSIFSFNIYLSYQTKNIEEKNIINEKEKESHLSLIMVGDNLIHDKIYNEAKTETSYDFKKMYSLIKPIVQEYDLAYYNQETILGVIQPLIHHTK